MSSSIITPESIRAIIDDLEAFSRDIESRYSGDILGFVGRFRSATSQNRFRFDDALPAFKAFHSENPCAVDGCSPCTFAPDECAIKWLFKTSSKSPTSDPNQPTPRKETDQ